MKTHVISLDNHDDYISINDKIVWAKSPRILMVWPDHGRVRLLKSDLILIIRKAESVGSQIAVVSDDPGIMDLCKQLNVSVFSSIPEAQKRAWRRPKKTRRLMARSFNMPESGKRAEIKKNKPTTSNEFTRGVRFIIFIVGLLAFFMIIGLFIPSAEINLSPKTSSEPINISVWSNPNVQTVNLSGAIPIKTIPFVVEASIIRKSSGVERIPTQFAAGSVVFRNLTSQPIEIPVGTVVRTITEDLVRFKTLNTIFLEGGIDAENTVAVTALNAGVGGNVNADKIQAVEGEIGGNVVVYNPLAISGGSDTKATAPSELDYQQAKKEIMAQLIKKVDDEFLLQNNSDVFLKLDELTVLDEILIEKRNPEISIPADQFEMTIEARFLVSYLSRNDVHLLATQIFATNLAPGFTLLPETLTATRKGEVKINSDTGEVRVNVIVDQKIAAAYSESDIISLVTGKSSTYAYDNLAKIFEKVNITIYPSFIKRLPYLAFRIKVNINEVGS